MKQLTDYILESFKINSKVVKKNNEKPKDNDDWEVGDILSGTYGYNMTLPIFYKIVKRTAKMIIVVKLSKKLHSGHYNGSFEEVPNETKEEQDLKGHQYRAKLKDGKDYAMVDGHFVKLWDGKPVWGNDMD